MLIFFGVDCLVYNFSGGMLEKINFFSDACPCFVNYCSDFRSQLQACRNTWKNVGFMLVRRFSSSNGL